MKSIFHISNLYDSQRAELENEFKHLLSALRCVNWPQKGHDIILTFLLSAKEDWCDNHDEILEIISSATPLLFYAKEHGAKMKITTTYNMHDYRKRNLTCFSLSEEFTRTLACHDISLAATVLVDDFADCRSCPDSLTKPTETIVNTESENEPQKPEAQDKEGDFGFSW